MEVIYHLCLIFNPRWLKHQSGRLNVDRAYSRGKGSGGRGGGDADPARSDGYETARISSRYDEYHSAASLRVREI